MPPFVTNPSADDVNYIASYPLLQLIGQGGMGEVWLSEHPNLRCPVAIKILDSTLSQDGDEYIQRFITEGQLAASLVDPHIVKVLDAGEDNGKYFIVMEYVDGCTAEELMEQRGGKLPYEEVVQLAISMCRALDQALKKGIIHRDMKPDNILVTSDGLLKLADLGIAKRIHAKNGSNEAIGTPNYISPEQVIAPSKTSHRSDIYSLGVSIFQLVSGTVPFSAPDITELAMMHVHNEPPCIKERAPDISDALAALINRMMAKSPDDRYQDYATLIRDLEAIRDHNVDVGQLDTDTAIFAPIRPEPVETVPKKKKLSSKKKRPTSGKKRGRKSAPIRRPASTSSSMGTIMVIVGILLCIVIVIIAVKKSESKAPVVPVQPKDTIIHSKPSKK